MLLHDSELRNGLNCTTRPPTRGRVVEAGVVLIGFLILAAVPGPRMHAAWQFASGVNLVEVYVTVTDAHGQPVIGLTPADFAVFEDDQPQAIAAFAAGEFPLSVALGIDRSFSMKGQPLALAKSGARAFAGALRPVDRLMVVAIGSETIVAAPLSGDRAAALAALEPLDAWGTTPLYDATIAAIDHIQAATGRRALILLSDGADRYSRMSARDVVARARASDVLIYPVATGRARPPIFAELATVTGGRSFFLTDPRELQSTLTAIARELRTQYLLGYAPSNLSRGSAEARQWRSIRVAVVSRPDAHIRHRTGYFSR